MIFVQLSKDSVIILSRGLSFWRLLDDIKVTVSLASPLTYLNSSGIANFSIQLRLWHLPPWQSPNSNTFFLITTNLWKVIRFSVRTFHLAATLCWAYSAKEMASFFKGKMERAQRSLFCAFLLESGPSSPRCPVSHQPQVSSLCTLEVSKSSKRCWFLLRNSASWNHHLQVGRWLHGEKQVDNQPHVNELTSSLGSSVLAAPVVTLPYLEADVSYILCKMFLHFSPC